MTDTINFFKTNGYAILPGVISTQKINLIFEQINFLIDEALKLHQLKRTDLKTIEEKYLFLKTQQPEIKGRVYDLIKYLDSVTAVALEEKLVQFVKDLSQTPILIDNTRIRIDDASNDRAFPLHQEGLGQISAKCLTAWIPLHDITEETGGLMVVPGTHTQGFIRHQFYNIHDGYHGVAEDLVKDLKPISIKIKKGDLVVFHPCIFHGTALMKSKNPNQIRWTLVTRYNGLKEIPYLSSMKAPLRIEQMQG